MKIAVGTDDKETIRRGHFGESQFYRVIELLNGEIVSKECRQNPNIENKHGPHDHGQAQKPHALLSDCSLFMAKSMGKKSMVKLAERQIDCIITKHDHIDLAVAEYLHGNEDAFKYYDARKSALIPCSQRMMNSPNSHIS